MNYTETINALRSSHQLHNDNNNTDLLKKILKEAFPNHKHEYANQDIYTKGFVVAHTSDTWIWSYRTYVGVPTIKLSEVVEDCKCEFENCQRDSRKEKVIECDKCKALRKLDKKRALNNMALDLEESIINDGHLYGFEVKLPVNWVYEFKQSIPYPYKRFVNESIKENPYISLQRLEESLKIMNDEVERLNERKNIRDRLVKGNWIDTAISNETVDKLSRTTILLQRLVDIEAELNELGFTLTIDDSKFKI